VEANENGRPDVSLVHRLGPDADVAHIADAMVSMWQQIDVAMSPVVGRGGLAALYGRALSLAGSAHPWLAPTGQPLQATMDLAALRSVLATQTSAEAASGCAAFLEAFHGLLNSLIGSSLTSQLLGGLRASSVNGRSSQDP
jgi:hypothetical protein